MTEDLEFETYLKITKKNFGIYLFDTKKKINLYDQELKFEKDYETVDYELLSSFLDDNIFNIEKLIGKFIQNVVLIIENNKIFFVNIGVKKKNYEKRINKIYLENILTEAKDLIKDTYQDQKIIHMLITSYKVDGINFSKFTNNISSDNLCLEIKFISIPNKLTHDIEKILEKYQIKVSKYLDHSYVQNFFEDKDLKISEMAYKVQNGVNENEVSVIPKNFKKLGFFEKFFQLFS